MVNETARIGMTVENAISGKPLEVDAEIAASSIAVRVGDTVYAVHRGALSMDEAGLLAAQLTRLARMGESRA